MGFNNRIWVVCLLACISTQRSLCNELGERTKLMDTEEIPNDDSGNLIMKEDAEEVFYNVDLEKYDGVHCPKAIPPDHGSILGSGTEVGSVVYVQCERGFQLHGPTVMSCVPFEDTARWDPIVNRFCLEERSYFDESKVVSDFPEVQGIKPVIEQLPEPSSDDGPFFIHSRDSIGILKALKDDEEPMFYKDLSDSKAEKEEENEADEDVLSTEVPPMCLQPPVTGRCKAFFQRYYYDEKDKECRKFVYGGCGGNENNFQTLEDCTSICSAKEEQ